MRVERLAFRRHPGISHDRHLSRTPFRIGVSRILSRWMSKVDDTVRISCVPRENEWPLLRQANKLMNGVEGRNPVRLLLLGKFPILLGYHGVELRF